MNITINLSSIRARSSTYKRVARKLAQAQKLIGNTGTAGGEAHSTILVVQPIGDVLSAIENLTGSQFKVARPITLPDSADDQEAYDSALIELEEQLDIFNKFKVSFRFENWDSGYGPGGDSVISVHGSKDNVLKFLLDYHAPGGGEYATKEFQLGMLDPKASKPLYRNGKFVGTRFG